MPCATLRCVLLTQRRGVGVTSRGGLRATVTRDIRRSLHAECVKPLTTRHMVVQLLTSPELRLVIAFRFYTWLWQRFGGSLPYYLYTYLRARMGCDIGLGAVIGPGLRVVHRADIVIGSSAVLGADVDLYNGVTVGVRWPLGATVGPRRPPCNEMPTIGNRVMLCTGAKILGGIKIGDDVVVAANAVVLHDVESGATVAGIPARPVGTRSLSRANLVESREAEADVH